MIPAKWSSNILILKEACPNKHGSQETNSKSSVLRVSVVLTNFNRQNKVKSARVYFMLTVKDYFVILQNRGTTVLCLYV